MIDTRHQVLRDPELDQLLHEHGMVQTPLLQPDDIAELLAGYHQIVSGSESGMQIDYLREDRGQVRELAALIRPVLRRRLDDLCIDHRTVLDSFVVKRPGPDSAFYLHRDVGSGDERYGQCFTLWIPLVDVGHAIPNGGLVVLPGSHELPSGQRGVDASALMLPYQDYLRPYMEPIEAAAGTAVVYDCRTIHGSPPNLTDDLRPAVGCMLIRGEEAPIVYEATGRRHRRLHRVDDDFFIEEHPGKIVQGGVPDRYPVIAEFDDLDELLPSAIGDAVRRVSPGAPDPVPAVHVTPDVLDGDDPARLQDCLQLPPATVIAHQDLEVRSSDVEPFEDEAGGLVPSDVQGQVWVRRLWRGSKRVHPVPDVLAPVAKLARPLLTRDASLIVVEPFARITLHVPERRWCSDELITVESPQVRSGLRIGDRVGAFDLGTRFPLPGGSSVRIWNDGPGQLVLLHRSCAVVAHRTLDATPLLAPTVTLS